MKIERAKFLSLCVALASAGATACGATDDGTSAAGSDLAQNEGDGNKPAAAESADAVVTVDTKSLTTKAGKCSLDLKAPVVKIPANETTEAAVNKVLAPLGDVSMAGPCKEGGGSVDSKFVVTANGNGLLSIKVTGSTASPGAAHGSSILETFNFDIKNGGKELKYGDIMAGQGAKTALAACAAVIDGQIASNQTPDPAEPPPAESFGTFQCKNALSPDAEVHFEPLWVATAAGLEVVASVSHAQGDFQSATVPWKNLTDDGLTPSVVLDFAKAR